MIDYFIFFYPLFQVCCSIKKYIYDLRYTLLYPPKIFSSLKQKDFPFHYILDKQNKCFFKKLFKII